MSILPSPRVPDSTLAMLRDPYRYISRTARALGTDIFQTRVLLRPTVCLTGPDAAELFYRPGLLRRHGAMPSGVRQVLFGPSGVQGTDGEAHKHRKAMFLSLMSASSLDSLEEIFSDTLGSRLTHWCESDEVNLHDVLARSLLRAVCRWAGVPLAEDEVARRTEQMTDLFEHAGRTVPYLLRGGRSRRAVDGWAEEVITGIRAGRVEAPPGSAARTIAEWKRPDGQPLAPAIAAVELVNVLRPTVAVALYGLFAAHALHRHPELRDRVREDETYRDAFVHEVRRLYPFFPVVAAIAPEDIVWRGMTIAKGRRVILDLYGTCHDPRTWSEPDAFSPDRFLSWPGDPYTMIPQGGGDHAANHRCPGEWITIRLMSRICIFLTRDLEWEVAGDPDPDYSALPALPKGGFVISNLVARAGTETGAARQAPTR